MGRTLAPAVGRALDEAGLLPGDVLLVSSGRTVYEVAQHELTPLPGVVVAPTVGGNDQPDEWYQTNEITRLVANRVGGRPNYLFAPALPGPDLYRIAARRPEHPACAASVAARPMRADGCRRTAVDPLRHPPVRAHRFDVAARCRRRRVLALLRSRRRPRRVRGRGPVDRRGTRSAAPHPGDDRRRRRQGQDRLDHCGSPRRVLQPAGHRSRDRRRRCWRPTASTGTAWPAATGRSRDERSPSPGTRACSASTVSAR